MVIDMDTHANNHKPCPQTTIWERVIVEIYIYLRWLDSDRLRGLYVFQFRAGWLDILFLVREFAFGDRLVAHGFLVIRPLGRRAMLWVIAFAGHRQ